MIIWQLLVKGGYVMWPILLCSFAAVAIFVERWQTYGTMGKHLVEAVQGEPLPAALSTADLKEILQCRGQAVVNDLENRLSYLEAIVTVSPLLGLLGTVTGMIASFNVLALKSGQPFAITGGVSEALIATAFGLVVAILALVFHTILLQKERAILKDLEDVTNRMVEDHILQGAGPAGEAGHGV